MQTHAHFNWILRIRCATCCTPALLLDHSSVSNWTSLLQVDWGLLLNLTHHFYRSQWVGTLPAGYDIKYRDDAFVTETGPTRLNWGDISGGIMEGGLAGIVRHQQHYSTKNTKLCRSLLPAHYDGISCLSLQFAPLACHAHHHLHIPCHLR